MSNRLTLRIWRLGALLAALSTVGCAGTSPAYQGQRAFDRPEAAVEALVTAVRNDDSSSLETIFGPGGRDVLSSGDPVQDQHSREVFAVATGQGWRLEPIDSTSRELIIGHEEWPFPIPLRRDRNGWWFDLEEGRLEVLARRIGRNELAVIGAVRTYAIAQREYASRGHDGKPAGIYAQRIRSEPGTRNGLYWAVESPEDEPSPLSELAAQAAAEGYTGDQTESAQPFHGYHFRILTAQGPAAPGGARDFIVNGQMTGGFALIAFPADYRNSGVMTFMVGPDGVVYEADLGEDTAAIATRIAAFNPDEAWSPVE